MIKSGTPYTNQVFKDDHHDGDQLSGNNFHECVFDSCSFLETIFQNCSFTKCTFRGCDLSLAQVPNCAFTDTRFEGSKAMGINWAKAHWPETRIWDAISFSECAVSHSTFIGLRLPALKIRDCLAVDVDFRETDLTKADFSGTDLTDSLFQNTDLTEADFSQARNYRFDPSDNTIKRAKFSFPEAMSLLYSLDIVLIED
jgi:uncharacterized protein YjbI with pentapeptide repeats